MYMIVCSVLAVSGATQDAEGSNARSIATHRRSQRICKVPWKAVHVLATIIACSRLVLFVVCTARHLVHEGVHVCHTGLFCVHPATALETPVPAPYWTEDYPSEELRQRYERQVCTA